MAEKITCSMVNHGLGITWQGVLTPCCQWYPEGNQDLEFRWNQYQGYRSLRYSAATVLLPYCVSAV